MGLNMDDLHTPTVPAGPTSVITNGTSKKRTFQEIISAKEALETQLSALGAVLDSHGVNMNTSLISFDGYPRSDIDVAQIRTTRAQIIHLKNDHKAVMKELENAVHEQFADKTGDAAQSQVTPSQTTSVQPPRAPAPAVIEAPFARVNSVVPGSPAAEAGLQAEDRIVSFGPVNWTNHERLSKVAQTVQRNENREILVKVSRSASTLELRLTPRANWGGRGMLGCHLLPL